MPDPKKLKDIISKMIKALTKKQGEILAKRLSAAFVSGFHSKKTTVIKSAAPTEVEIAQLQLDAMAALAKQQLGYLAEYNAAIETILNAEIQSMIENGLGYAEIQAAMVPYIENTFGKNGSVTINRTGQTKTVVEIDENGNLRRVEKEITRPYSSSIEAYTEMLSRTTVHQAYMKGRAEGYKAIGLGKWRYSATPDERVRTSHISLHGRVFEFGTDESDMAEEVLSEVNCRCRQIPFFDDSRLDTNQDIYEQQKEKVEGLKNKP